jgi:HSP20 family molecular chaperone IbpA
MSEMSKELDVEKQEMALSEDTERTRDCQCFVPRADIYEVEDNIVVAVDVPGADEESIEITLEKNVLTIDAYVDPGDFEGYSLAFAEYQIGDFHRSFRLSNEIDRDAIEATVKDGVLRLTLPKAQEAKMRKIAVKVGA